MERNVTLTARVLAHLMTYLSLSAKVLALVQARSGRRLSPKLSRLTSCIEKETSRYSQVNLGDNYCTFEQNKRGEIQPCRLKQKKSVELVKLNVNFPVFCLADCIMGLCSNFVLSTGSH